MYARADTNGDGRFSWSELSAQGGADCDDWAAFTCGPLRYWGWDPPRRMLRAPFGGKRAYFLVHGQRYH